MGGGLRHAPRRTLFILFVLVFVSLATVARAQVQAAYTLGPGDRLRVIVFGEEDLSGEYEVDGTGAISFKLVGRLDVGGRSLQQTEAILSQSLRTGGYLVNPKINIEMLNFRPFFILGEVEKRGQYPYVNGMTVANAVAIAGGYTYRAAKNRVTVQRFSDTQKREQTASEDTPVMPGDIIRVPERFF